MNRIKILILGCGGFIGSHLIDYIIRNKLDIDIIGYDKEKDKLKDFIQHIDFYHLDIYDNLQKIENLLPNIDIVIFLASICNPSLYISKSIETIQSNFINPSRIVELCTKYKKWLISFSTCEVYGKTISSLIGDDYTKEDFYLQNPKTTNSILGPIHIKRWCYASSKELLDRYIYANYSERGLPFTIIRPYNFFGSKMDFLSKNNLFGKEPRILASFISSLVRKEPLRVVDGGKARRIFTDIDDAIEGIITIIKNKDKSIGKIFNIGNTKNEIEILEMAKIFQEIYANITNLPLKEVQKQSPIVFINSEIFYGKGYEDCDRRVPDISMINELGWFPKYNLIDTLNRSINNWIKFYNRSKEN